MEEQGRGRGGKQGAGVTCMKELSTPSTMRRRSARMRSFFSSHLPCCSAFRSCMVASMTRTRGGLAPREAPSTARSLRWWSLARTKRSKWPAAACWLSSSACFLPWPMARTRAGTPGAPMLPHRSLRNSSIEWSTRSRTRLVADMPSSPPHCPSHRASSSSEIGMLSSSSTSIPTCPPRACERAKGE